MENGTIGDDLNPWAVRLFQTLQKVDPQTPSQQAAYAKWLDERADREAARNDQSHGAVGVIPLPLWFVLLFTAAVPSSTSSSSPTAANEPSSKRC